MLVRAQKLKWINWFRQMLWQNPTMEIVCGIEWNDRRIWGACRSTLQLGLSFTLGLKYPSKASGKAHGWVEPASGQFLPHCSLWPLSPFQTMAPLALWLLCWCLSVTLFWGCNDTKGHCSVCLRKSRSINYLENFFNKISKIQDVDLNFLK